MESDPFETTNVLKEHPEVAARYSQLMADSQGLVAEETLSVISFKDTKHLADIGGGTGAILTTDGSLDPLFAWNVQVGGAHYLSETLALNMSLAWASFDDSELRPDDRLLEGGTAHFNVIWSPFKSINTGIEYIYGLRRNVDGADGSAHRLQAMIKFIF